MEIIAFPSRSERESFCAAQPFERSARIRTIRARYFTFKTDARGSVLQESVSTGGENRILFELQFLVVLESLIRRKEQEAKSISKPPVIAQKPLQPVLFAAHLVVDGCDLAARAGGGFAEAAVIGLRASLHGVDQRDGAGPEIEREQSASVGWPEQGG